LTPFAEFLGGPLTQKKGKLENRGLSCQSFSEMHMKRVNTKIGCIKSKESQKSEKPEEDSFQA
jgi:hypothetical protein